MLKTVGYTHDEDAYSFDHDQHAQDQVESPARNSRKTTKAYRNMPRVSMEAEVDSGFITEDDQDPEDSQSAQEEEEIWYDKDRYHLSDERFCDPDGDHRGPDDQDRCDQHQARSDQDPQDDHDAGHDRQNSYGARPGPDNNDDHEDHDDDQASIAMVRLTKMKTGKCIEPQLTSSYFCS